MIEQKYIDEVLDKVDLTEVAEDYGITLKLKGHRAWACCPFHNEDTASFCIDTAKNSGIVTAVTKVVMSSTSSWRRMALLSLWP